MLWLIHEPTLVRCHRFGLQVSVTAKSGQNKANPRLQFNFGHSRIETYAWNSKGCHLFFVVKLNMHIAEVTVTCKRCPQWLQFHRYLHLRGYNIAVVFGSLYFIAKTAWASAVWSNHAYNTDNKSVNWRSRSFEVINFCCNRTPMYDFLLVINCHYRLYLASQSQKPPHPSLSPQSRGPFEFRNQTWQANS